ncbi:acyl-ACP thioesterase domain-containing protein [Clostridium sp. SM-530-WT-3G]|uniref:acyl-[acyl-carrier-protein] thioesterase n=1 Tax=Clostridium sp. SM-530-WT-3G TaxID=2725303 RepID=UPI00145F6D95|nr:acyl-ACP thioesterase domain-containing protein [Clostridium sp. SM-530-WT-3G]NME83654.1 acyl-[acyl-carrier-protein] thioesterase [Clostridium sp. SM-530-WT-3G]
MGYKFTKNYEVHYYEVDSNLRCKLSSIIEFIGDIGTHQSEEAGGGMKYCMDNNCAWVFYQDDIKMYRYPMFGEIISITTEAVGFKRFYGLRRYVIRDSEDKIIGEAEAIFFLIDIEKRRPMRIQKEQYGFYGVDGDVDYDISLEKLHPVEETQYTKNFNIRYSDIDSNKHVNNVKYIEWAIEAVPMEIVEKYQVKRIKVMFEKECKYGEVVSSSAAVTKIDDNNLKSQHIIKNGDGKELTLLEIEWGK